MTVIIRILFSQQKSNVINDDFQRKRKWENGLGPLFTRLTHFSCNKRSANEEFFLELISILQSTAITQIVQIDSTKKEISSCDERMRLQNESKELLSCLCLWGVY